MPRRPAAPTQERGRQDRQPRRCAWSPTTVAHVGGRLGGAVSWRADAATMRSAVAGRSAGADRDLQPLHRQHDDHVRSRPFEPEERRGWFDDSLRVGAASPVRRGRRPTSGGRLRDDEPLAAEGGIRHDGGVERLLPSDVVGRGVGRSCIRRCSRRSPAKISIASSPASASRTRRRSRCTQRFGFRQVGVFSSVGRKFGKVLGRRLVRAAAERLINYGFAIIGARSSADRAPAS